jgi:hypothetical protein
MCMVRPERFELPTYCSGGNRSIHLSYGRLASVYMARLGSSNVSAGRADRGSNAPWQSRPTVAEAVAAPLRPNARFLPAASSAPATAPSATVSAAIAASAATVASATSGVLGLGARLVHVERPSAYLRTIQPRNGLFSVLVAGHFHKAEPARPSGIAVGHDADPIHLPERFKHLPQFVFRCVKTQVPYKNILHASASALSCRSASSMRRTGRSGTPS